MVKRIQNLKIQIKRLSEIYPCGKWDLKIDSFKFEDPKQGHLGDCYFISILEKY